MGEVHSFTFVTLLCLAITVSAVSLENERFRREATPEQEQALMDYLRNTYEKDATIVVNKQVTAEWDVATDVNNKNKTEAQLNTTLESAKYGKQVWEEHFKGLKPSDFKDPILQREVMFLSVLGTAVLDDAKLSKLNELENNMTNIYSTAKICPYKNQECDITKDGMPLDPDIQNLLSKSTDYDELEYAWKSWRDESGAKIKQQYKEYVGLVNNVAQLNGFKDMGEMWRKDYESETFIQDLDELWAEVKPLYDDLHAYVLRKLKTRYPDQINSHDDFIPAHIVGNMWAQSWTNIYDLVKPFPNASAVNIDKALKDQGYTALKMFETADEFYQSLGLEPNGMCYNTSAGAVIEKPTDREILCHASAWDFQNGQDYRIKMCTNINMEDFITIHHEMGHIQYFILYKDQPITLRTGANPGFHEAIGDTIALSVATPQHLQKIHLLTDYEATEEAGINALMNMALERVAFLPFGLLIDKWRWDVFSGDVPFEQWNQRWWHYRETIQKIKAPVSRTEDDFDPGAKFHVPGNSQYIAYFIAHILEFQLHRSLCITAGEYNPYSSTSKPLHECDIYRSREAGAKLRDGLSMGSSRHWSESLKAMTGETKLTGSAILEYFKPLHDYLKQQNNEKSEEPQAQVENRIENAKDKDYVADDQIIPIVVGSIIGALVLISIVVYLVMRKRRGL